MPSAEHDDLSTSSQGIASDGGVSSRRASTNVPIAPQLQPSPKSRLSDTPLTPEESPPFRDHRKRSAEALDQDEVNDVSPSHTRDGSTESLVNFCLCQPEPKVPRPRNAFILYRQNRQAAVVAQNPGLANPEISKIIGEQWRNEPEGEKNRWKAYAEEEKLQHQQRYPSYRYQPKRSGRRGSVSSESGFSQSDQRKCQKCGGRTIIHPTPSTPSSAREKPHSQDTSPSSAYHQPSRLNAFQLPPPTPSSTTTPSTRYLPMRNNLSLSSPHPRNMSNGRPPQPFMGQRGEDEHSSILSPDSKRRRFESPQGTYVMSTRTTPPRHNAGPGTPFPFGPQGQPAMQQGQQMGPPHQFQPPPGAQHLRRESLPRPADLLRGSVPPNMNMMGPPPRPGPGYSQHRASQGQRPGGPELSLTLPPLQAGNMSGPPTSTRSGPSQPPSGNRGSDSKEPDRRSVGEIIMSMSFMAKIQILGRVAPPFPANDNKSRGTIIAIEGDDPEAARNVTDWLEEFLGREGDMVVKVVDGPKLPEGNDGQEVQFQELLRTVGEWHEKSKKIEELVRGNTERKDSDTSLLSSSGPDSEAMEVDSSHASGGKLVILLRTYTVTASNVFASRVAIRDAYKAADHWQWTATLWRGIVGPDMTVYVKEADKAEDGGKGGVEIKEENRIMAVRRFKGSEENGGVEGIEAGTLRRLGFEVGEWVRSGGGKKE
ncbi:hypothetical protein D6C84_08435 [Aureobasidium pullulans]|uniref:HMG box domain-containing protein n=1 Tax=Aureobasidium pullulans TaxID=5580 RepID=A0A4S9A1L1_AURPU|nr:hypothetical protein D6D19_06273 [Aureobasidium pullulans]THZ77683.1 hypothetical protein D6C84_08435 [Aureobasidium pullulans]